MAKKRGGQLGNKNAIGNRGPWGDKPITDLLRKVLVQGDYKKARRIAENLTTLAATKEFRAVPAIKEVLDRVEGKVAQPLTGGDGGPITVEVIRFGQNQDPGK